MSDTPRLLPTDAPTHGLRTTTCGALREDTVGETVTLQGWVDTRREVGGGLIFTDLRDRYGITQLVFSPELDAAAAELALHMRAEDVVSVRGEVRKKDTPNPRFETGAVEVWVSSVEVLAVSETPPFVVSESDPKSGKAGEELRLQHRTLDLRRPSLQKNLVLRHRLAQSTRRYFDAHDFIEIETPVLMKSTPEGARDYLVPSRVHPGRFYALPQSPQTYKQLLMVAGMDRYVQITKCFRDEDLRADRQPEFTQIDVEVTFATEEMIYGLIEGLIVQQWADTRGIDIPAPFPRMAYAEAMRRFGSDKPDLRFGMEIADVTEAVAASGFGPFGERRLGRRDPRRGRGRARAQGDGHARQDGRPPDDRGRRPLLRQAPRGRLAVHVVGQGGGPPARARPGRRRRRRRRGGRPRPDPRRAQLKRSSGRWATCGSTWRARRASCPRAQTARGSSSGSRTSRSSSTTRPTAASTRCTTRSRARAPRTCRCSTRTPARPAPAPTTSS